MPARLSVRSSRSTAQTSTKPRSSNIDAVIPDEGLETPLRTQVCSIFSDIQKPHTAHRKLVVGLRKIQETCCYEPADNKRIATAQENFDEEDFNAELARCVLRILPVKKSEPVGDRIVKFLGLFFKHATDADNAIFAGEDPEGVQGVPETPTSRLAAHIMLLVLPLTQARDRVIRFRSTQIISHLINTLDAVDDELFHHIRLSLLKRLRDRESTVRVQAVCGLGRIAGEGEVSQDPEDSDDDSAGLVLDRLLDILQNDPCAEVRRSLLLNLPFTPCTLPYLLERARDLDGSIRRVLYARLLPALGDFRHLSLTHREKLLRWGLRDRDDNVRNATGRLFSERWIEDCTRPIDPETGEPSDLPAGKKYSDPSSEGLCELLERIDVVNAGNDGGIALDAMHDFWERRPDYREFVTFDESYWKFLTPEGAFVARTFSDFCRRDGIPDSLLDKIPEGTRLAYLIQSNVNSLVDTVRQIALQEEAEEDSVQQEFIVEQLLHMALTVDYADEVGRRTMFSLMREALAIAELPEEATRLVVEVLRATCGCFNPAAVERDFCGVVLEAIAEVHDTIMGEEPPKEASSDIDESFRSAQSDVSSDSTPKTQQDQEVNEEKLVKEIMVNMKCLHIAQCMLQNVECNLQNNAHLVTMLNNLVVPAVRSQEAPIRERGLLCLGLCCLLDKNLADENLSLFLHCFSKGHEQLQTIAIQIIGDILAAHPSLLFNPSTVQKERTSNPGDQQDEVQLRQFPLHKPIHKLFSKSLKSTSPAVQSTACAAISKLMLSAPSTKDTTAPTSILNQDELLRLLTTSYFDPETASNPTLRQSLSYFIPVYCHSRLDNLETMGRVALTVLSWCISMKEEMDVNGVDPDDSTGAAGGSSDMVGLAVVVAHLVDWTDGRKLAVARSAGLRSYARDTLDGDVHLSLAKQILQKIVGVVSREERKLFISMLGKLYVSVHAGFNLLKEVSELLEDTLAEAKAAPNAISRNTLNKVQSSVTKAMEEQEKKKEGRSKSRDDSSARFAADGEDTEAIDNDALISEAPSAMTTPTASPRKRATRAPNDAAAERSFRLPSTTMTPIVSPQKSQAKQRRSPKRSAAAPRRKTAPIPTPSETGEENCDDARMENQENIRPLGIPSPEKKNNVLKEETLSTQGNQGRTKRETMSTPSTQAADETATIDEFDKIKIKIEDSEDVPARQEQVPELHGGPARRGPGRPSAAEARGGRRSVRDGVRTRTAQVAED